MNWRPALPALSRSAGVHSADLAPDPLRSKGSPTARYQRPVLGHSGPSCRGAQPTNPRGAAQLHSACPATMRTSGGLAAPGRGHLRWCLETERPLEAGSQGRPRRQLGPSGLQHPPLLPRGHGTRPGGCGPRPGTWRGVAEGQAPGAAQGSETHAGTAWPVRSA